MSYLLLLVALIGFGVAGFGVSLLRANERPPLTGSWEAKVRAWFGTLHAQRAVGAMLVAAGALTVVLVLVFRP